MYKSNLFKTVLMGTIFTFLASCSKDEDQTLVKTTLETKTFSNLNAPQTGGQGQPIGGSFTKFSFSQNAVVTDNNWDIAFRGTTILVNGGTAIGITDEPIRTGIAAASMVTNTFEAVVSLPETSTFKQDGQGTYAIANSSGLGWYNYTPATNLITPIAGKVLVIKTFNGKYAKMEILSYYKDAPTSPDANSLSRYYTFRYVYQPDGNSF